MDRCPNCGNKLSEIDVLCPKCGTVVEVIKASSNIPSPLETIAESSIKNPVTAQKKDIPKYFNVYYEGLPDEGDEDDINNETDAVNEVPEEPESSVKANQQPESPVKANVYQQPEPPVRANAFQQPESPFKANAYQQPESFRPIIEESYREEDKNRNRGFNEIASAKNREEDDYDYSSRYLENLKNLHLPEIEDISNFDPEEYMREYKYKKILGEQAALGGSSDPAKKQWLEIEETNNNLDSELAKVREDVQKQAEQPEIPQRRYKGPQDSRTERKRDYTEKRRDYTERVPDFTERKQSFTERTPDFSERYQDIPVLSQEIAEDNIQIPAESKKARKPKAVGMVLFWVVISVAIFFGCMYLDNAVKYSKGIYNNSGTYDISKTYDNFLYSITNGQVGTNYGNQK